MFDERANQNHKQCFLDLDECEQEVLGIRENSNNTRYYVKIKD